MQRPDDVGEMSERHEAGWQRGQQFFRVGGAYMQQQGTKPSTTGFAVGASPIGLLAW